VSSFRPEAAKNMIVNARWLLNLAGLPDSPMAIERVILSAPRSDAELAVNEVTESSFCINCLTRAQDALPGNYHPQLEEVAEYFIDQLPKFSPRERSELEMAVGVLRGLRMQFPFHRESTALRVTA